MTTYELSTFLDISPRRVEQLLQAGVLIKNEHGLDLKSCTVNYVRYLRHWRSTSKVPCTYSDLAALGANSIWIRKQLRARIINKRAHGKYDVGGIVRDFIEKTMRRDKSGLHEEVK